MPLYLSEWLQHRKTNNVELAKAMNINHSTIHRWRRGERPIRSDDIEKLAKALGVEPGSLWKPPTRKERDSIKVGMESED